VAKILISGGSGLLGTRLTDFLVLEGFEVVHLSRRKKDGPIRAYEWNVEKGTIDPHAFDGVDTIIHLAGEGIADKRWTKKRKTEILESRTQSTQLLFNQLKQLKGQVANFISASAIGYYGLDDNQKMYSEQDAPGKDFLATVVRKWEQEVDKIKEFGIRVVKLRVGIVLSEKGGALAEIVKPVKLGVGAPLGSGDQNISWVHLDDVCRMFVHALKDSGMNGPYNATGPYPVTNQELTKAIAKTLGKPLILPKVPGFTLRLLLGEMADLVLKGNRVSSQKLVARGFQFRFANLQSALDDLLK
jgi:uncharacterized protein